MEPDCYIVEVVHYLNPHLIWVRNRSNDTLEQIGVYGIIPLDMEVLQDNQDVAMKASNVWMPAASYVMKKVFMEATAFRFEPTYIHRRSSIFDTNIHKYGELYIEKIDGRRRKLSDYLTKSKTALYNEGTFHQQLSFGLVQTKLSQIETDEVMKVITSKLNDAESIVSLNKQTEVYQAAKKLEALTTENLNKHNSRLNKQVTNKDIMNVLERKFKDLQLCKDIDGEVQHRATRRNKTRLEKLKSINSKNGSKCDDSTDSKTEERNTSENYGDTKPPDSYQNTDGYEIDSHAKARIATVQEPQSPMKIDEFMVQMRTKKHSKKHKSTKNKIIDFDVTTHKLMAYSPPGVDKSKLVPQIVPIKQEDPVETIQYDDDNDKSIVDPRDDMFGEVDSAVKITITNKEVLKMYNGINNDKSEDVTQHYKINEIIDESPNVEARSVSDTSSSAQSELKSKMLQKKLQLRTGMMKKYDETSSLNTTGNTEKMERDVEGSSSLNTTSKLDSDDDDDVSELIEKYTADIVANVENIEKKQDSVINLPIKKNYVNPFQNVDPNLSVFVDKLLTPVLMVHAKNNWRIEPVRALSEVPFNAHVHNVLRNMNVDRPMTMQSVSWFSILRGFSTFLIGPQGCGKTMGYLPSICRLISDFDNDIVKSVGPVCVVVAATAQSVSDIEYKCRLLLGTREKIFSCYAGMDLLKITTSLLNGCELFICTPCVLVRLLLQTEFGLDLRRLTTFVLDDCERLEEVYKSEVRIALSKIKDMLKTRVNKEVKVQYILASRVWCDFMEPLAKKAPNTVICIGAFQECVLYSKANTDIDFVRTDKKTEKVLEFMERNAKNKKTVIVCRTDEEVGHLESVLKEKHNVVYACNSDMTVEDLRNFNKAWNDFDDPIFGPILVCCDGNLSHMNITDAHNLVNYSMPELFSTFCKRFSVLNDHYPSLFKVQNESVAIKIILEKSNAEQLPKICNFIKRCIQEFPKDLEGICKEILTRKDMAKATNLVPICANLLALGECPDFWYCRERHTSCQIYDEPKQWMPTDGIITFRILHFHNAVMYSARLLSNIKKDGVRKYPQTYSTLSLKLGIYYSQECNKKLLGVPKIGDVCAVSVNENFFVRCQVVDIINKYRNGLPNHVLIKLIDEEKLETSRDIYLYHLPEEFRETETYVVQVSLAGVLPKDKDVTFSELAKNHVKKAVENNESLYMRGKVMLTVGNRIFVDNIDVCQDLTSMNEVVVKNNFKEMLAPHSEVFPHHMKKLKSRLFPSDDSTPDNTDFEQVEEVKSVKERPKVQWAHLNREDLSLVYFTSALDPNTFFVRLTKFEDMMVSLCKDINKYTEENSEPLIEVKEKDIVLAKFPDSQCYERARVDIVESNKAKCFFVDYGDWRKVPLKHLIEIPEKFIHRIPFQAIECRLIGIRPVGEEWTDFSTNWLCDRCDSDDGDVLKGLYVQYYSTDKAEYTGGNKYAVALIDTNGDTNVVYNTQMIDLNLAAPKDDEIDILNNIDFTKSVDQERKGNESNDDEDWTITEANDKNSRGSNQPLRSMPLIDDDEDSDSDRWSFNLPNDFMGDIKPKSSKSLEMPKVKSDNSSDASSAKIDNVSATSEYEVIKGLKIKELDSDDLSSVGSVNKSELIKEISESRKPKLLWRQNKAMVIVKIMLVGAEDYELIIQERSIHFSANIYDTDYKFQINLYGIVDKTKSSHAYKGQYILVKLFKLMRTTWLTLTKECYVAKWIVYDHDCIEASSDEEDVRDNTMAEIIKNYHKDESESDDDFCDDTNFGYPS